MRAAIAENIGTYLHRSYDIFDDNARHLKWIESLDPRRAADRSQCEDRF